MGHASHSRNSHLQESPAWDPQSSELLLQVTVLGVPAAKGARPCFLGDLTQEDIFLTI